MRSIEGRMRSSADPLPVEMWSRAVTDPSTLTTGVEASSPDAPYSDEVMTQHRVEAIRNSAQSHGESGQRLMKLVGIETELE